jgi:hypothetical protein
MIRRTAVALTLFAVLTVSGCCRWPHHGDPQPTFRPRPVCYLPGAHCPTVMP